MIRKVQYHGHCFVSIDLGELRVDTIIKIRDVLMTSYVKLKVS